MSVGYPLAMASGFGAVIEFPDHKVKQHLRISHTDDAVFVYTQGNRLGMDVRGHNVISFPQLSC